MTAETEPPAERAGAFAALEAGRRRSETAIATPACATGPSTLPKTPRFRTGSWRAFVQYADALIADLQRDRAEFWGGRVSVADALLAGARDEVALRVRLKLEDARANSHAYDQQLLQVVAAGRNGPAVARLARMPRSSRCACRWCRSWRRPWVTSSRTPGPHAPTSPTGRGRPRDSCRWPFSSANLLTRRRCVSLPENCDGHLARVPGRRSVFAVAESEAGAW